MSIVSKQSLVQIASLGIILSLVSIELFFSYHSIPIPLGDSLYFYPASYYFKNYGELINPIYNVGLEPRLIWHGWLHAVIYSYLAISKNLSGILIAEDILVAATILLYIFCLRRIKIKSSLLTFVSILSFYTLLVSNSGRPEILTSLLLLVWHLAHTKIPYRSQKGSLLDGIALGIIGVTNPYCGLLFFILLIIIYGKGDLKSFLYSSTTSLFVGITISFLLAHVLYPYTYSDWLSGLYRNLQIVMKWKAQPASFSYHYFANPNRPLLIGWLGLLLIATVSFIREENTLNLFKKLLIIALISLSVWFTLLRVPERSYYLVAIAPLLLIFLLNGSQFWNKKKRDVFQYYFTAACMLTSIGLIYRYAKNYTSYIEGLSYQNASRQIIDIFQKEEKNLDLDIKLKPLLFGNKPNKNRLRKIIELSNDNGDEKKKIMIIGQASSGLSSPPKIEGYSLTTNKFYSKEKKIFGIKIFNTLNTYEYAIYSENQE